MIESVLFASSKELYIKFQEHKELMNCPFISAFVRSWDGTFAEVGGGFKTFSRSITVALFDGLPLGPSISKRSLSHLLSTSGTW